MNKTDAEKLRAAAEAKLAPTLRGRQRPVKELLHELRVHQIELEMQNEQLRQSQLELEKSRDRYVDFYDFSPVAYLTLNHDGMIAEINLTCAALFEVERNKLPLQRFASFIAVEDRELWHRHFLSALHNDQKLSFELAIQPLMRPCFYAHLECLRLRKEGEEAAVRIVLTDITGRKQTEQKQRESEDFLKAIIETCLDGVVRIDAEGVITGWNRQAEEIFGWSGTEAIGLALSETIIPPQHREAHVRGLRHFLLTGEGPLLNTRIKIEGLHRDGHQIPIELAIAPISMNGKFGFNAFIRDTTQLRQIEIALEQHRNRLEETVHARTMELSAALDAAEVSNRTRNIFMSTVSHELLTPMNVIMGMTELALSHATDAQQIAWLTSSNVSARHLLAIINDILDLSQIEADHLTLVRKEFSLMQLFVDTLHTQSLLAQAKSLNLSCEIAPTLPDRVCGDVARLRQILMNLTDNAIKFSERGQITVRASTVEQDSCSLLLCIEVSDQGLGLSPAQQLSVFDAYTQADGTTRRKRGGTGLGLAISRRIARLMGGDLGVNSQQGTGSTFWATVRLGCEGRCMAAVLDALARHFKGARVLVAEGDSVIQEVIMMLLEEAGLTPELASNGQQALEMARDGDYALILLDDQLSVMSGLEVGRTIRQLPGLSAIPMLAMTACAFGEDHERCLAAGMNDHICKPVTRDAFYQAVLHCLESLPGQPESRMPLHSIQTD